MAKSEVENKIKNKVLFAQEEIDTVQLWANIEDDLQTSNRRRPVIWIFLFGLLLFAAGTVYKLYNQSGGLAYESKDKARTISDSHLNDSKTIGDHLNEAFLKTVTNTINESKKYDNESGSKTALESIKPKLNNSNSPANEFNDSDNSGVYKKTKHNSSNTNITNQNKTANYVLIDKNLKQDNFISEGSSQSNNTSQYQQLPYDISIVKPKSEISFFNNLPRVGISIIENQRVLNLPIKFYPVDVNRRKIKFIASLEISGGYALPFSKLESKTNSQELIKYLDERSGSLMLLEAFDFEALGKLKLKSGFFVKAGLAYMQINERFVDSEINLEVIERESEVVSVTTNSNGMQFTETGDVEYLRESITNKYYFTTYRTIHLPVILGYELQKAHFLFDASAGTNIGLSFQQIGMQSIFNEGLIQDPDVYKSKLNVGARFDLGVGFCVSKNISIWSRLNYYSSLSSISKESYAISHKLSSVGGKMSLEIKF